MSVSLPIVGGRYRPPSVAITNSLSVGTKLHVIPEPENEFDANALAVYIYPAEVSKEDHEVLAERLPGGGCTLEEFLARDSWHLGYIPKKKNEALKALMDQVLLEFTFCPESSGFPALMVSEVRGVERKPE